MHRRHTGLKSAGWLAAALAITAGSAAAITAAPAIAASATGGGTLISTAKGPYGKMLVVGSGKYKGYSLYAITSDHGTHYGCTTKVVTVLHHHGTCTGPSNDTNAEWPALTTSGKPVAGTGVTAALLGEVDRPGIGYQVTYAGHPLYLFDTKPHQVTGEGFDEPTLPPWHGVWWVVSPAGDFQPWVGKLTTMTIGKKVVVAAIMDTITGAVDFPVYTFSGDSQNSSTCGGACAWEWPPLITSSMPTASGKVVGAYISVFTNPSGYQQAGYDGMPLYLYAGQGLIAHGSRLVANGNGSGKKDGPDTFSLVRP
jgi:predicted lipoprotein with Yx(FWY)xxD motif